MASMLELVNNSFLKSMKTGLFAIMGPPGELQGRLFYMDFKPKTIPPALLKKMKRQYF